MHRRKLLDLLQEYQQRHPQEVETIERFAAFVQAHRRCFERDCWAGHVTGSAWFVDPAGERVLLTHHRKLGIWVQLGGHSDGDSDTLSVALREAEEESGLAAAVIDERIFDIDIHEIPARKPDPAHFHFDVRFALGASGTEFAVSQESLALAWVAMDELHNLTNDPSVTRMREKWLARSS